MSAPAPLHVTRRFRRDATPALAVILHGRDVRTGATKRLPRPTDVLSWTIRWPAPTGDVTKTSAANGGLTLDPRTGTLAWPLALADLAKIPAGGEVHGTIYLIDAAGRTTPYIDLVLTAEDRP